ncbi:hypothetical protein F6V30_10695, partial [Oryzomonas sagensis]
MKRPILEAFKLGDRVGTPWESNGAALSDHTYDEIMNRAGHYPDGTDESDIVDCWCRFIADYNFTTINSLLLDWCLIHYAGHRATSYGQTWQDHFSLMKSLIKKGPVDLDTIQAIAQDRNSFGNGCLALVYPVHCYARTIEVDSQKLVEAFTRLTHTHTLAIEAVGLIHRVIAAAESRLDAFAGLDFIELTPEQFIEKYPNNVMVLDTLRYALYCV